MSCSSKNPSFENCELAIMKQSIKKVEEIQGKLSTEENRELIEIMEEYIQNNEHCICYGGTAINNLIPDSDKFYDYDVEMPDYDVYTPNPIQDAKKLADIYFKRGYTNVVAKSGVHYGTYKVFVNYVGIADFTLLHKALFAAIKRESISINGIMYAPPNFLKQSMYRELSQPHNDTSRWEKVLTRLNLLNKHYPFKGMCKATKERKASGFGPKAIDAQLYEMVRANLVRQKVVFIGGYANTLYESKAQHVPDFDVISLDPKKTAKILEDELKRAGFSKIKIVPCPGVGELIHPHFKFMVGDSLVALIFEPTACHSYNVIRDKNGNDVNIGSIDTLLSFYMAFLFADRDYLDKQRLLCLSEFLFEEQERSKHRQEGVLKRFSIDCYGQQETMPRIMATKEKMFKTLKRGTKKYEEWFLKYVPAGDKPDIPGTVGEPGTAMRNVYDEPERRKTRKFRKSRPFHKRKTTRVWSLF
jgi:hypothetical protein